MANPIISLSRSAWMACCLFILWGCASKPTPVPDDWPGFMPTAAKGECVDITGVYNNTPTASAYEQQKPWAFRQIGGPGIEHYLLSEIFGRQAHVDDLQNHEISYVTIQPHPDGHFVVKGWPRESGTDVFITHLLPKHKCINGFVNISDWAFLPIAIHAAGNAAAAAGWLRKAFIRIGKAVDGSIIVNITSNIYPTTILMPIPIMTSVEGYDRWHRYEPYNPQSRPVTKAPAPVVDILKDDYVNCFSNGARKWTYQSKCD